jgi:hypothetical protein
MSATDDAAAAPKPQLTPRLDTAGFAGQAVLAGLTWFAVYHIALAIFMAAAPHAFFKAVGPFGAFNSHYIRDTASFEAALGLGLLIAIRRPSWRVPVLAVVTVQFALHSANHLLDIGKAHPHWTGYFDFFSLLVSTALLAWLWRAAARAPAVSQLQNP